ncbi:MAG: hypothetical protein ACYC3X_31305 [Pirellulaceae bacterium]
MATPKRSVAGRSRPAKPILTLLTDETDRAKPATVGGCNGLQLEANELIWVVEDGAAFNYRQLADALAATGDLYRHCEGHALLQVLPSGKTRLISKGSHLAPLIVDLIKMVVTKGGKVTSELPAANHLNAMLRSEKFLGQFRSVDVVTTRPFYLDDFTLVGPGYTDGGLGQRILYLGPEPHIADSTATIELFLKEMFFASDADRTNTVAAALTVLLHRHWLGQKPMILVTANRSHSGKGTITIFICGPVPKADLLYQEKDWPMRSEFHRQLQCNPEIGVVLFDNVRCDSSGGRDGFIRSAFIESFVTTSELSLAPPGPSDAVIVENHFVVMINANDGRFSPDMLNRSLQIHIATQGNVHERETLIGNPKLEFLPANRDQIEAELLGMIERWKAAGRPLDNNVRHSMSPWAKTIGGILEVNGFHDFLGNVTERKAADDPVHEALAVLGAAKPGQALRPAEWAKLIMNEGLAKKLLPPNERDTESSRTRATGKLLTQHLGSTIVGRTDTMLYRFHLEGGIRRWDKGKNPHVKYVFTVLHEEPIPEDADHA